MSPKKKLAFLERLKNELGFMEKKALAKQILEHCQKVLSYTCSEV